MLAAQIILIEALLFRRGMAQPPPADVDIRRRLPSQDRNGPNKGNQHALGVEKIQLPFGPRTFSCSEAERNGVGDDEKQTGDWGKGTTDCCEFETNRNSEPTAQRGGRRGSPVRERP